MKRIISAGKLFRILILCSFTVFFTGCNSGKDLEGLTDVPVYNEGEVSEDILTIDDIPEETVVLESQLSKDSLNEKIEGARDARFDGVSGPRAFWFPEGHPADRDSLKQFHVLGLINGTFYYSYVTQPEDSDTQIHAVARYNYKNHEAKLLLERKIKADADDTGNMAFHAQLFKRGREYRICVYEDGNLILLDNQGKKLFSFTDDAGGKNMLDTIHKVFDVGGEYYDAEVTDVITDGDYGFYIPVTLIKEDYMQAEDAEQDITMDSYLFSYLYLTVDTGTQMICRDNLNWDNQQRYYRQLAARGGLRDPQEDWEEVLSLYPDRWGDFYLGTLRGEMITNEGYLKQWVDTDKEVFTDSETGVPTTHPDADSVKRLESLSVGETLENVIFVKDSPPAQYDLIGEVKSQLMAAKTVERIYIYSETITETDSEGNEYTTKVMKTASDSVEANWKQKFTLEEGAFINVYAVKAPSIGTDIIKSPVKWDGSFLFGYSVENKCILGIDPERPKEEDTLTFPASEDGSDYDICLLNTVYSGACVMASDLAYNRIYLKSAGNRSRYDYQTAVLNAADLASRYRTGKKDETLLEEMKKVGSQDAAQFDFSEYELLDNPSIYTGENVVVMGTPGAESFLFTSFHNGMQLYQPVDFINSGGAGTPGTVWQISDWPIYQAWPVSENKVAAIGFDRTDTVYESMDIAMARVYTFDVNEIKKSAPIHKVPMETPNEE